MIARVPTAVLSAVPTAVSTAVGLVLLVVVSACGTDPVDRYCQEVRTQQKPLTEAAAATDGTGLLQALPSFEALRSRAPEDLVDSWAVVVQRISALRDALAAADVDPAAYDPEDPPDGLSEDDQAAIAGAASGLVTKAMTEALGSVQQQARDVCKTPLSR